MKSRLRELLAFRELLYALVIRELKVEGGLLGIFENEDFPFATVTLQPGEKVVLFSDGLEPNLIQSRDRDSGVPVYTPAFVDAASLSADGLVAHVARTLDGEEGSLNPLDDSTLLVLEVGPE